jgi:protein gp37
LIHPHTGGWNGDVRMVFQALQIPWRWSKGRKIFVDSMSDLFHPLVPFEYIAAVFHVMAVTTRHTYQVLTKRPERMLAFFQWLKAEVESVDGFDETDVIYDAAHGLPEIKALPWEAATTSRGGYDNCGPGWPYKNVWLGVSVENQETADERIPLLLQCPAAVRWISAEPLLGPIDLTGEYLRDRCGGVYPFTLPREHRTTRLDLLDWVVAGGESGPGARPMHPDWARSLRDQCAAAGVPFLFKQWGNWLPPPFTATCTPTNRGIPYVQLSDGQHMFNVGKKAAGRLLDGVQHDGYPA